MSDVSLTIQYNGALFYPAVEDGIEIEQERRGSPSKMTFNVLKDGNISFGEGATVTFSYKGTPMFVGYVFAKQRSKDGIIKVTAYDQMRYMQNKFTYVFTQKTATQIIQLLCKDFNIKTGSMEDTGYVIPSLIEENKSIMDIALDALDETLRMTGKLYIMYDNAGSLELKELGNMKTNVLIDEDTAEDFDYTTSIDSDVYNKVVLYYVDPDTNDHIPYTARDDSNIQRWGLLQYFDEVKIQSEGETKAAALLKLYDKITRGLTIKNAFGNPAVRAGSMVIVKLNLGDEVTNNYMLIEKVKHKFTDNYYTMELTMNGNWGKNEQNITTTSPVVEEPKATASSDFPVSGKQSTQLKIGGGGGGVNYIARV